MPEPIFIIIVVSILAGTFSGVVKMVLEFMKSRQGALPSGGAAESMTASELERLLENAVRRATTDLSDRLESIEERLQLPPHPGDGRRLDVPDEASPADKAVAAPHRRMRA